MLRTFLVLQLLIPISFAGQDPIPSYSDTNSVQALRSLEKIGARDPARLTDAEGVEWGRARFAWIALLRLEGKDKEAVEVFTGCGTYCGKWGNSEEWTALKKWGCSRAKGSSPCTK